MAAILSTLEAAMAAHLAPRASAKTTASKPYDITKARGYSPALGAIYSPKASVAHMADCLEADGVAIVRTEYGFRTATPAEKAEASAPVAMTGRAA